MDCETNTEDGDGKPMTEFTKEQLTTIRAFLLQVRERATIADTEWADAAPTLPQLLAWARVAGFAAQDTQTAIWWYRFRSRPGSIEWRPVYVVRALITASERDYAEIERMPPN